jgi:superfamily II RNA helicase
MRKIIELGRELEKEKNQLEYLECYLLSNIEKVGSIMKERGFIMIDNSTSISKEYTLSERGKMATMIAEIHPLLVVEMMEEIEKLTTIEIIGLLSSFTDIKVPEDRRKTRFTLTDKWKSLFEKMTELANWYERRETELGVYIGYDYTNCVYDLVEEMEEWCNASDENACRHFVHLVLQEKQISLGDFSKAVLKISTITKELMNVCEMRHNMELLHKLSQIDGLILKYITTNQSLYV